jgi:hypothetical protein
MLFQNENYFVSVGLANISIWVVDTLKPFVIKTKCAITACLLVENKVVCALENGVLKLLQKNKEISEFFVLEGTIDAMFLSEKYLLVAGNKGIICILQKNNLENQVQINLNPILQTISLSS